MALECALVADDDEAAAVGRPKNGSGEPISQRDLRGARLRIESVDREHRPHQRSVTVGRTPREGQRPAVRRPRRAVGVIVAVRQLAGLSRDDIEDEQLLAHGAERPRTIGLVVEPVNDDRVVAAGIRRSTVDRGGEGDVCAVRAPDGSTRACRQ